ncbi:MAG: hypothetical protein IIX36_05880 [Clostridia bacterium]|nr:hypothetical protein [Clostridia bacterium]
MKKALALVLALLVAFSMFSIATFAAEGDTVKINFVYKTPGIDEGNSNPEDASTGINTVTLIKGGYLPADAVPQITEEFEGMIDGKTYRFTFKGWRSSVDNELYYAGTIHFADDAPDEVTFTAEYAMEDISGRQSFWNFIESLFERINKIFEYFAVIFNW